MKWSAGMSEKIDMFLASEHGMETVEWAVLVALIVSALIVTIGGLTANVHTQFQVLQVGTQ
jgi:Flp pilus assembly pilin Flp